MCTRRYTFIFFITAMDRAKEQGHQVSTCIVVRHLQRLNAYYSNNTHNGMNGDSDKNEVKVI